MKKSLLSIMLPLLLALPLTASADEREWMPYQKLVETNHIRLRGDEDLLSENPLVIVSERPFEAEIDTK